MPAPRSRYYDGRAYARFLDPFLAGLHQYVADHVEPAGRILDVGCGTGDLATRLAGKANQVVGVELSPAMVDWANRMREERDLANVEFLLGDATTALSHLPDGHFDLATAVLVFHEMPDGVRPAVLSEVTRVARRLLCLDFRAPMPWNLAGMRNRLAEVLAGLEHFGAFREYQRSGGLAGIADRAGLPFEHVRHIDGGTMEVAIVSRATAN